MKNYIVIGAMLPTLFLFGCAKYQWTKSSFTQQDFARDSYECERDARQSGYFGEGWIGAANMRNFYDRCLVARGYQKVKVQ